MKKTFIALAALAAGTAFGQSSVTLFGVVDIGIERTSLSPGGETTRLTSG